MSPELTPELLHAVISDVIWLAQYSDLLESSCELADHALGVLGFEPLKDGVGPWPDHHHSIAIDNLL